ncbi:MAG: hypothetical protein MMC33_008547 [Icmadophila ericetorum]|nr:hypothetical protein [Icmadophila ericetorum]
MFSSIISMLFLALSFSFLSSVSALVPLPATCTPTPTTYISTFPPEFFTKPTGPTVTTITTLVPHKCFTYTTTTTPRCVLATPVGCIIPECIREEFVTMPCVDACCPKTKTVVETAECTTCQKGCATAFATVTASCAA